MDYLEFRLKIFAVEAGWVQIESLDVEGKTDSIRQPVQALQAVSSPVKKLDDKPLSAAEAQEVGSQLHRFLFSGKIKEAYNAGRNIAASLEKGLRIRLQIGPPALSYLPWELLYDPEDDFFLSASPETLLTRCPIDFADVVKLAVAQLRVLVVLAEPSPETSSKYGLSPLSADKEVRQISQALNAVQTSGIPIEFEVLRDASIDELHLALAKDYSILHFIGHGAFEDDAPFLLFADAFAGTDYLDGNKFVQFFSGRPSLRLVFLNSCSSAMESEHRAMSGLAAQLAAQKIPAVVANRNLVADKLAVLFAQTFYGFLAAGFPVDAALNEARLRIRCETGGATSHFATPVGYMAKRDGRLFELAPAAKLEAYENLVGRRNRQLRKSRHVQFSLFGLKIFSFLREHGETYLGRAEAEAPKPIEYGPLCGGQETLPLLWWRAAEKAEAYQVAIYELTDDAGSAKIFDEKTANNSIDLAQKNLALKTAVRYKWQVRFAVEGQSRIHQGLFWLLSESERQALDEQRNRLAIHDRDLDEKLAECALLFAFKLYDRVIALAEELLAQHENEWDAIPLCKSLVETYKEISRQFEAAQLNVQRDRMLERVVHYETQLAALQEKFLPN